MSIPMFMHDDPAWTQAASTRSFVYNQRDASNRQLAFVLLQPEGDPVPDGWEWHWLSRVPCVGEEILLWPEDTEGVKVTRVVHFSGTEVNETSG